MSSLPSSLLTGSPSRRHAVSVRHQPPSRRAWAPSSLLDAGGNAVPAVSSLTGTGLDPALAQGKQVLLILTDADGVLFSLGNWKISYTEQLARITGVPAKDIYEQLSSRESTYVAQAKAVAAAGGTPYDGHQVNTQALLDVTNELLEKTGTTLSKQDIVNAGITHRRRAFANVMETFADARELAEYAGRVDVNDPNSSVVMPYLVFDSCGQADNLLGMSTDVQFAGVAAQEYVVTDDGRIDFIGMRFQDGQPYATPGKVFTNEGKGEFIAWLTDTFSQYLNAHREPGTAALSVDKTYHLDGETDNSAREIVPVSISVYEEGDPAAIRQMMHMRASAPSQIHPDLRADQTVRKSRVRHHPDPEPAVYDERASLEEYRLWVDGLNSEDLRQGKLDLTDLPSDSPGRRSILVAAAVRGRVLRDAYLAHMPVQDYAPVDLGLLPGKSLAYVQQPSSAPAVPLPALTLG